ncbi:MAG: 30S ribosomal protein S17 [Candidatus Micrarchaeia archaeon]|jgi:small subunit ribosomal protein S17
MTEKKECNDKHCFKHGDIKIRGGVLVGKVINNRSSKTAVIQKHTAKKINKYKRYARTHSKIHAHNPPCINAQIGDTVKIAECRKISKTKAWTIIEILKGE